MSETYKFELHEPKRDPRNLGLEKVDIFPEQVKEWLLDCVAKGDYAGISEITKMGLNWTEICKSLDARKIIVDTISVLSGELGNEKNPVLKRKIRAAHDNLANLRDGYFPKTIN